MLRRLIDTRDDILPLVLRLVLGGVMFPHGAQKLLGWFSGYGFGGTMSFFTGTMHIPALFAFLAIMAEFFGSLGLLAGLLTRVAAFGVGCVMVVAVLTTHLHNGFFMNWFGNQKGEGFEYHLLVLGIVAVLMLRGGGRGSIDRQLSIRDASRPGRDA